MGATKSWRLSACHVSLLLLLPLHFKYNLCSAASLKEVESTDVVWYNELCNTKWLQSAHTLLRIALRITDFMSNEGLSVIIKGEHIFVLFVFYNFYCSLVLQRLTVGICLPLWRALFSCYLTLRPGLFRDFRVWLNENGWPWDIDSKIAWVWCMEQMRRWV
jgi:hypothetical protein